MKTEWKWGPVVCAASLVAIFGSTCYRYGGQWFGRPVQPVRDYLQAEDLGPGWELQYVGRVIPPVRNRAGEVLYGLFPYAGELRIRMEFRGDTFQSRGADVTNKTLVEFAVLNKSESFIESLFITAEFLDSWDKVIADYDLSAFDLKPGWRTIVPAVVWNLPREKYARWRVRPLANSAHNRCVRHLADIQPVEGSNVTAEVTIDVD
jgi:hypothetical protein